MVVRKSKQRRSHSRTKRVSKRKSKRASKRKSKRASKRKSRKRVSKKRSNKKIKRRTKRRSNKKQNGGSVDIVLTKEEEAEVVRKSLGKQSDKVKDHATTMDMTPKTQDSAPVKI